MAEAWFAESSFVVEDPPEPAFVTAVRPVLTPVPAASEDFQSGVFDVEASELAPLPPAEAVSVLDDPLAPDWRFSLVTGDRIVGEVYFDADHGWEHAERPRGWTLRLPQAGSWEETPTELELAPHGAPLRWAAREAALAEALRVLGTRLAN